MGFATLPNQVHRKSVKKGFDFTLMVAGRAGAGQGRAGQEVFQVGMVYMWGVGMGRAGESQGLCLFCKIAGRHGWPKVCIRCRGGGGDEVQRTFNPQFSSSCLSLCDLGQSLILSGPHPTEKAGRALASASFQLCCGLVSLFPIR